MSPNPVTLNHFTLMFVVVVVVVVVLFCFVIQIYIFLIIENEFSLAMSETLTSSPGQIDASQRKFEKPELAYVLAMGGQTDSQVGSKFTQVAKSRTFHVYTDDLRSACVDLRWVAKRLKTFVDLRTNLSSTTVNTSHRKSTRVKASERPNETQVEGKKSKTCVDLH